MTKISKKSIIVGCCYLPPESSPYGRDANAYFSRLLTNVYKNVDSDYFVLCGDLNSRVGNLNDSVPNVDTLKNRVNIDHKINSHGMSLIEFLIDAKLCLVNGRVDTDLDDFTCIRNGRSVVDYMIVPHSDVSNVKTFCVRRMSSILNDTGSESLLGNHCKRPDHSALILELSVQLKLSVDVNPNNVCEKDKQTTHRRYKLSDRSEHLFTSDIAMNALNGIINMIIMLRESQNSMDTLYTKLCDEVINEMNREIPFKDISNGAKKRYKQRKPYWNEELSMLWKEMCKKEHDFCKYKGRDKRHKTEYLNRFKQAQRIFDKSLRYHERRYTRGLNVDIEELVTSDPNAFWNKIQTLGPKRKNDIPKEVYINEDVISNNLEDVLHKWKEEFESLFNPKEHSEFDHLFLSQCIKDKEFREQSMLEPLYVCNIMVNSDISYEEVKHCIGKAKNKKACGIDHIPNEILKSENVINVLMQFYQLCFETSLVPSLWRKAIIYPIPKDLSNDPRVPMNYRGISLLCTMQKVYTSLLNIRLLKFFEGNGMFAEEQNGFRPGRSCQEHIFTLTSVIRHRLSLGKNTFATFIDFKKAFDYVNRDLLLCKLLEYGIDGRMYNSIKYMYSMTESCVQLGGDFTPFFSTVSGVRQGDSMSPTLFAVFINDLVKEINALHMGVQCGELELSILLYADDVVLLANNEDDMNKLLECVHKYCIKWRLLINKDKTKVVHFRKKSTPRSNKIIRISSTELDYVENYKYLGIFVNEFMSYEKTVETLSAAAGRGLGKVISKFKSMNDMCYNTYYKLLECYVRPVLEYGSAIWGFKSYSKCDQIWNRAGRFYLGVHRFVSTAGMMSDLGWLTTKYLRWLNMLRFWNHLLTMNDDRLTKKVFQVEYENKRKSWCSDIKEIFAF